MRTGTGISLNALPGDDVRRVMWRWGGRADLEAAVRSARGVARTTVAGLVSAGARQTHEWTGMKARLLEALDAAGISAAHLDPAEGGTIDGPKSLALALVAFELAWVDAGAASGVLAGQLALAPLRQVGTAEQRARYLHWPAEGSGQRPWRGAFCLTEPLPYVGVETGVMSGTVRVAEWAEGAEPVLQVDKRGRFITNMGFANLVIAAVESADPRLRGTCLILLEEGDPGTFDRGTPTRKLVHQLSSTRDPVFSLRVPASRIVGGYRVEDGAIVPRYGHAEVIDAVLRRSRVTVGLMTAAKLLSAVEPVLRYQRERFRGAASIGEESPRFRLGLQLKEDGLHRLLDVWAAGEASASLGFAAARLFDEIDTLAALPGRAPGNGEGRRAAEGVARRRARKEALAVLTASETSLDPSPVEASGLDLQVRLAILEAQASVLSPAVKLWNTGNGATMMREAVSLMGGYGITEDCPGFLGHKWMDAQFDAVYEGPEVVQRRRLARAMTDRLFLAQYRQWMTEMAAIASSRPGTGACTVATAMRLWLWTLTHLQKARDAQGQPLFRGGRQGVTFPLADALCWLLAVRHQILDVLELEQRGAADERLSSDLPGLVAFLTDLCHVQAGRAAGEVGRICAELAYGYNRHPAWDVDACTCYQAGDLEALEELMPGMASFAPAYAEVLDEGGGHRPKAGPCAQAGRLEPFARLRSRLDGCLTGARLAKDRAAAALTRVRIPDALDY